MRSRILLLILGGVLLCLSAAPAPGALAGGPGPSSPGDIDCDTDVDSVDALKDLRHVAGLPVEQPGGCPEIGTSTARSRVSAQGAGGMAAMSVDMELTGNSATSVLSIQDCARLNANGIQDAEETAVDTLTFDITAQGIPVSNPMIGFNFTLNYDPAVFQVTAADAHQMLTATQGSNAFDASESVPNSDGAFDSSAVDIGPPGTEEKGDGVLDRISVTAGNGAATGDYSLTLTDAAHIENVATQAVARFPNLINDATVSINKPCGAGSRIHGDVDCDKDVDTVDGLFILRTVAALEVTLPKGCPPIA